MIHRRLTIAILLAVVSATGTAQSTSQVALLGGTATDARGVTSNAVTLAPSWTFPVADGATFSLGASGTWFQSSVWSAGASLGLSTRSELGAGFAFTTDLAGSGAHMSFDANIVTADFTPAIEWTLSGFTLFGGGHGAYGYTAVTQPGAPGALPVLPPGAKTLVSETRTGVAPVYGAQYRLPFDDGSGAFAIAYREEPMVVSGITVTDRTGSASLVYGAITIAGSAGSREASDEHAGFSNASLSWAMTDQWSLTASGGTYLSNRLTGTAGGNFMSLGVAMKFGTPARARTSSIAAPAGAPALAKGATRFAIRADNVSRVELAGDFTEWEWLPAKRADNGVWYADVVVAPGEYRYAFRVDGKEWRVPDGAVAVDDGFGGKSAFVTIRATTPAQDQQH